MTKREKAIEAAALAVLASYHPHLRGAKDQDSLRFLSSIAPAKLDAYFDDAKAVIEAYETAMREEDDAAED